MIRWQGPAYLAGFAALWLGLALRSLRLARASRRWPTVRARIVMADFGAGTSTQGRITPFQAIALTYEYHVDGETYLGHEYGFGWRPLLTLVAPMRALRGRRSVVIAYDPARPSRSVVVPGVSAWLVASIVAAVLLLGGAAWWTAALVRAA